MNDTTPLDTTPEPTPAPRRRGVLRPILIGVGSGIAVLALGIGGFAIADELNDSDDDRVVVTSSDRPVSTLPSDDSSSPSPDPSASSSNDDAPISQSEYDAVAAAALDAVGGGTVLELKRDDDPGKAWEVEIRLANGNEAEVELAADLSVLRIDLDS